MLLLGVCTLFGECLNLLIEHGSEPRFQTSGRDGALWEKLVFPGPTSIPMRWCKLPVHHLLGVLASSWKPFFPQWRHWQITASVIMLEWGPTNLKGPP